ncbi:MAG: hypothetical protein S0880_28940, partial [Actinomycetota bacterium]|nr:hypothetical protein [Actinomycetota bacterium]
MAEDKPQKSRNVARAARAAQSSRPGQQRRNYAFPAVIVAIVVLGLVLVAYGRSVRTDDSPVPTLDTLPPSETTTLDDETTDEGADDDATTDEGADDGTT